jgi:hypothetical protein
MNAPSNDKENKAKDLFYKKLELAFAACPISSPGRHYTNIACIKVILIRPFSHGLKFLDKITRKLDVVLPC